VSKLKTPDWNVLLYALAGDDDELKRVTQAIDDMRGALTTSRCNVAVQVHAKSKTTRHWISAGHKMRTEVLPVIADASEPSSLTSFLNAAHRASPDRSTALLLWAHSGGLDHVHDSPKKAAARQPGLDSVFGDHAGPGLGGGVGLGDMLGGGPDDDAELGLVVDLRGLLRQDDRLPVSDQRVGPLGEEQRRLRKVLTALFGVVVVVEPDADDLARPGYR
jgi:hypothetical protein